MLKLDDSGLKKYLEELAELVQRAAADGIMLNIENKRDKFYPPMNVGELVPELSTSNNISSGPITYAKQVDTSTLEHMSTNIITLSSHCVTVVDESKNIPVLYTYVHRPDETHPVPK